MELIPEFQGPMLDLPTQAMRNAAIVREGVEFYARCEAGLMTPEDLARRYLDMHTAVPERTYEAFLARIHAEYPTTELFDAGMREMGRTARERSERFSGKANGHG